MEYSISSLFTSLLSYILNLLKKSFNGSTQENEIRKDTNDYGEYSTTLEQGNKLGFTVQDIKEINHKPRWLNENKLKLGQKFAVDNLTSISLIGVLSLYLIFLRDSALDALIYTNKSSSPITASKRYLSTVMRVVSWYQSDLTDCNSEGYKNLDIVFKSHLLISKKMNSLDQKEKELTCLYKRVDKDQVKSTICPFLVEDTKYLINENVFSTEEICHFNQSHMAITQFGFVGLAVLYPHKFGITDTAGIENFVHLWRYIGHMLGIEDEHNLCSGTMEQVKNKMEYILEQKIKPHVSRVNPTWEHMSRMVVEGLSLCLPSMSFEASIVYVLNTIGIKTPTLMASLTWYQYWHLFLANVMFGVLLKLIPTRYIINVVLNHMIIAADKDFSEDERRYAQSIKK